MSVEFVSTMSLESFVSYVPERFTFFPERPATSPVSCVRGMVGELSAKPSMKSGQEVQVGCSEVDLRTVGELCIFNRHAVCALGEFADSWHLAPMQ